VSAPKTPGANVLVVKISGEAADRTALPTMPGSAAITYTISVTRGATSLGSDSNLTGLGPFPIYVNPAPATNDVVQVEGFNNGVKFAEGSAFYAAGNSVDVNVLLLTTGTGSVALDINFPPGTPNTPGEITVAELSIYQGFQNYQNGVVYSFTRYRKDASYGAGTAPVPSGTISLTGSYPSGNYVAQIDFFRSNGIRVSRLAQSFIVRGNLATNKWDNGTSTLGWNQFASSNANLGALSIGSTHFDVAEYFHPVVKPLGAPDTPTLSFARGEAGQMIVAMLNGVEVHNNEDLSSKLHQDDANSLVVAVTAPDGVTKKTYAVSYGFYHASTQWYVSDSGSDSAAGTSDTAPLKTVKKALEKIKTAYNGGTGWPGDSTDPVAARINISGATSGYDSKVEIDGANLPPILLMGSNSGTIQANYSNPIPRRPLTISNNATVILGEGIAITGGSPNQGGGVHVNSSRLIMNGGSISGNTSTGDGGGVYVTGISSFIMNGGTISGNTDTTGGGVYVAGGSFTMNGGTISGNNASGFSPNGDGGGVYVAGGSFIMNGGTIGVSSTDKNSAGKDGGGVCVANGDFTMNGGTIAWNTATYGGGGVCATNHSSLTITGGSLDKNSAMHGGGVIVFGDGVFSGNTFEMEGGTISGNSSADTNGFGGGGVLILNAGNSFTMSDGIISGNTVNTTGNGGGGGVSISDGAFTMGGGTISGNTVTGSGGKGGGVHKASGSFTMDAGTISGNTAVDGGGVYGGFDKNGGTVSGNSPNNVAP
jgi:hypothetical protein